jgi:outer membrane protein TolC
MRKLTRLQLILENQQADNLTYELLDQIWLLYYELLISEKKQFLQNQMLELTQKQLNIAELQKDFGSITPLDLIESKISSNKFKSSLNMTKIEISEKKFQLKSLLELDPSTKLELVDDDTLLEYSGLGTLPDKELLFSIAINEKLDLKKNGFEITKIRKELTLSKLFYIPTISADFSYTISGNNFPLQNSNYNIGLTIEFPLNGSPFETSLSYGSGDNNRSRSSEMSAKPFEEVGGYLNINQSKLNLTEAVIKEQKIIESLRFQIDNFLDVYKYKKKNLELERESIFLAEERLDILSDFLEAQTEYAENQIKLLSSILDIFQTERSVEKTLGLTPGGLRILSEI